MGNDLGPSLGKINQRQRLAKPEKKKQGL
uniref:Uncharacterized protein n=1 Tax=mine drainage metagenome TaxID=410659 RepID=E6PKY0_9ZZZZ